MDGIISQMESLSISEKNDDEIIDVINCLSKLTINTTITPDQKKIIIDKIKSFESILAYKTKCYYPIIINNCDQCEC